MRSWRERECGEEKERGDSVGGRDLGERGDKVRKKGKREIEGEKQRGR